jgi:hypothetical protein
MKSNIFQSTRLKSPLQYACSLGLWEIVACLLLEGADPNILYRGEERSPFVDYWELPLDIVMNAKHHNKHIGLDGLQYAKYFSSRDINFRRCL